MKIIMVFLVFSPFIIFSQWTQTGGPCTAHFNALTSRGNNIIAGTDEGIFLSTNNGASWAEKYTYTGSSCYSLSVGGGYVFAGVEKKIFISYDNGLSWYNSDELACNRINSLVIDIPGFTVTIILCNNYFAAHAKQNYYYFFKLSEYKSFYWKTFIQVRICIKFFS